jgi:hypothetical protein
MANKALPPPEVLRQLLRYEPDTGKLFWLPRPKEMFPTKRSHKIWTSRDEGKEALNSKHSARYLAGTVLYRGCLAHRVAWAVVTGEWPKSLIDHINGDKTDNRWVNLRAASKSQNNCNARIRSDNISGMKGVHADTRRGRFYASITLDGVSHHLGAFASKEEAHRAYSLASERIHGAFSRTS